MNTQFWKPQPQRPVQQTKPAGDWGSLGGPLMMLPPGGNPPPYRPPPDVLVPSSPGTGFMPSFPTQLIPGPERSGLPGPEHLVMAGPGQQPWDNTEGTGGPFNLQTPAMQAHMRGLPGCGCNRYRPAGQASTSQDIPMWQYAVAGGLAFAAGFAAVKFLGGKKKKRRR